MTDRLTGGPSAGIPAAVSADDVAQEVLLRLWRSLAAGEPTAHRRA